MELKIMEKVAVYPGTFDPITYGHIDIVKRASEIFEKVIISVAENPHKNPIFTIEERVDIIKELVRELKLENVEVDSFSGLLVDYLKKKNVRVIIRGLRVISDFDYEFSYSSMNKKLWDEIETLFLMTNERYSFVSSTLIKEVFQLGGDVSDYAPEIVINKLKEKMKGG
jgi:pantetheine-phosphate adenylyltransferase